MIIKITNILLLFSLLWLASCTTTEETVPSNPVQMELIAAGDRINQSFIELAQIYNKPKNFPVYKPNDPLLLKTIDHMDWQGPIEQAVSYIIDKINEDEATSYKLIAQGKPFAPVYINIEAHDMPIYRILQTIGFEAGNRASIIIDETNNEIILIHHGIS